MEWIQLQVGDLVNVLSLKSINNLGLTDDLYQPAVSITSNSSAAAINKKMEKFNKTNSSNISHQSFKRGTSRSTRSTTTSSSGSSGSSNSTRPRSLSGDKLALSRKKRKKAIQGLSILQNKNSAVTTSTTTTAAANAANAKKNSIITAAKKNSIITIAKKNSVAHNASSSSSSSASLSQNKRNSTSERRFTRLMSSLSVIEDPISRRKASRSGWVVMFDRKGKKRKARMSVLRDSR